MAKEIAITVVLTEEQIKDVFEECEVRMTKDKLKKLENMMDYCDIDIKEQLEDTLKEVLGEMISDEWSEQE